MLASSYEGGTDSIAQIYFAMSRKGKVEDEDEDEGLEGQISS